ncbi:hypothetical protein D3C76_1869730 [compost metagenome]
MKTQYVRSVMNTSVCLMDLAKRMVGLYLEKHVFHVVRTQREEGKEWVQGETM